MATTTLNLANVFGVNVEKMFRVWFENQYLPAFRELYPDKDITAVLLDPRLGYFEQMQSWDNPLALSHIVLHSDNSTAGSIAATAPGGTLENVKRKLCYCLRIMANSVYAEEYPESIREGDFPWEGAGEINGIVGGVSGLKKDEDWAELKKLIAKLRELLRAVNGAAVTKAAGLKGTPEHNLGAKYLIGINVADQFPGYEAEAA